MEDGELFAAFRPEAQLSVASETTFGHLLRSYRTSQAGVDDGQHAVIDGNNSLIMLIPPETYAGLSFSPKAKHETSSSSQ